MANQDQEIFSFDRGTDPSFEMLAASIVSHYAPGQQQQYMADAAKELAAKLPEIFNFTHESGKIQFSPHNWAEFREDFEYRQLTGKISSEAVNVQIGPDAKSGVDLGVADSKLKSTAEVKSVPEGPIFTVPVVEPPHQAGTELGANGAKTKPDGRLTIVRVAELKRLNEFFDDYSASAYSNQVGTWNSGTYPNTPGGKNDDAYPSVSHLNGKYDYTSSKLTEPVYHFHPPHDSPGSVGSGWLADKVIGRFFSPQLPPKKMDVLREALEGYFLEKASAGGLFHLPPGYSGPKDEHALRFVKIGRAEWEDFTNRFNQNYADAAGILKYARKEPELWGNAKRLQEIYEKTLFFPADSMQFANKLMLADDLSTKASEIYFAHLGTSDKASVKGALQGVVVTLLNEEKVPGNRLSLVAEDAVPKEKRSEGVQEYLSFGPGEWQDFVAWCKDNAPAVNALLEKKTRVDDADIPVPTDINALLTGRSATIQGTVPAETLDISDLDIPAVFRTGSDKNNMEDAVFRDIDVEASIPLFGRGGLDDFESFGRTVDIDAGSTGNVVDEQGGLAWDFGDEDNAADLFTQSKSISLFDYLLETDVKPAAATFTPDFLVLAKNDAGEPPILLGMNGTSENPTPQGVYALTNKPIGEPGGPAIESFYNAVTHFFADMQPGWQISNAPALKNYLRNLRPSEVILTSNTQSSSSSKLAQPCISFTLEDKAAFLAQLNENAKTAADSIAKKPRIAYIPPVVLPKPKLT